MMKHSSLSPSVALAVPLLLAGSVSIAAPPPAAPMMTPQASKVLTSDKRYRFEEREQEEQTPREEVMAKFSAAYQKKGRPKIALFWNRELSDRVTSWEVDQRDSISQTGSVNLQGNIVQQTDAPEGEKSEFYSTPLDTSVDGKGKVSAYREFRREDGPRYGMGELFNSEFGSGFMQPFFDAAVQVVDRAAIIRLQDRETVSDGSAGYQPDRQRLETSALLGYSDFLAEVVMLPDDRTETGFSFRVTVKEVSTGIMVAMFKSEGTPPREDSAPARWVATDEGYQREEIIEREFDIDEFGEQIAYETLEALARVWSRG
jgi:hypothetical protein